MSRRDPNSVSGVKTRVAGGSTVSVARKAALRTGSENAWPGAGVNASIVPSAPYVTSTRDGT